MEESTSILKNKILFMGPAQQEFDSLNKQATYFLDTYWPNWNNYADPRSYILPPVFKYKHPEVSDAAFESFQLTQASTKPKNPHEVTSDRVSDEAEFVVYNSIQKLIQDKVQAPFIAVRNLDLRLNYDANKQLHGSLTSLFPNIEWNKFQDIMKEAFSKVTPNAEFDFILIGPKFGIVVIEVKSSSFKREEHFKDGIKSLPNDYKHGLAQLRAVNALVYLLQEAMRSSTSNDTCIRKIIFTPNLTRARFDKWVSTLDENGRTYLNKKINQTVQWFQEDIDMDSTGEKSLYNNLGQVLQSGAKMSLSNYEVYCPNLAAIASITLLPLPNGDKIINMDKLNFSKLEAGLKEHSRILDQNPFGNQSSKLTACSQLKRAPKQIKDFLKVIFLTPDQQKAFQGPRRQIIFGAAGTGKTLVLQAKALECLAKGGSVAVLTPQCHAECYKALFDSYGFEKFIVYNWELLVFDITNNVFDSNLKGISANDFLKQPPWRTESFVKRVIRSERNILSETFGWLLNFDNIFIDDTLDIAAYDELYGQPHRNLVAVIFAMALAQKSWRSKLVWAAVDPVFSNVIDVLGLYLKNTIDSNVDLKKKCYYVTVLKQVMRCSENIFNAAYNRLKLECGSEYFPVPGHKVQGVVVTSTRKHFSTFVEARTALWRKIEAFIKQFCQLNFNLSGLAIIVDSDNENLLNYLALQCRQRFPQLQFNSNEKTSLLLCLKNGLIVAIRKWEDVSSLEWPAVIFASCELPYQNKIYRRYRAMSRATSILVDISVTYDKEDSSDEVTAEEVEITYF